jgi:hypothetical protein
MGKEVEGRNVREGGMRHDAKRKTHIQILTKNLSSRRYNDNHHHRLSSSATPIPAYAITKYTGVLPSSRSTSISHHLARILPHSRITNSRTMLYILHQHQHRLVSFPSLSFNLNHLSPSRHRRPSNLCYRGWTQTRTAPNTNTSAHA